MQNADKYVQTIVEATIFHLSKSSERMIPWHKQQENHVLFRQPNVKSQSPMNNIQNVSFSSLIFILCQKKDCYFGELRRKGPFESFRSFGSYFISPVCIKNMARGRTVQKTISCLYLIIYFATEDHYILETFHPSVLSSGP